MLDETDGLRDTGEREAAAGSIDEGYGEVSEFIDKSSIDLTRDRTCSNTRKSCHLPISLIFFRFLARNATFTLLL